MQFEAGIPLPAIRDTVEAKYKNGRPGTPTPRPPASAEQTASGR